MEEIDDLLIATTRLVLTLQRGILTSVHHGFGPYYGITWDEKYIYLVARGAQRAPPRFIGNEKVLVLRPNFDWIGEFEGLDLVKLHQIHFSNGQLFICNTGRDRVDVINSNDYSIKAMKTDPDDNDLWINSVWTNQDGIYVVEHRRGPSKIKHINNKFELLGEETGMGDKMHNVYIEDGKMIVCSSEAECMIIRDLSTGKDRVIDTSQYARGLPRGLARTKDRWYIGISKRVARGERHRADDAALLVFDDEFNLIKKIILEKIGQLHEIRATTGLDRAHNGMPFPKEVKSDVYLSSINLKNAYRP